MGWTVVVIGGKFDRIIPQKSYPLEDLNIDSDENRKLINESIKEDKVNLKNFKTIYDQKVKTVQSELAEIFKEEEFDLIIVHNIFSLPLLVWSAVALKKTIEKFNTKTFCVNHDFYFERDYFMKSSNAMLPEILRNIFPTNKNVKHEVINSLSQKALLKKHKLQSKVLGDFWDFNNGIVAVEDDYNSDFLESQDINRDDIFILQATRIIPRKAIENAIYLVSEINKKITKYEGKKINGKLITPNTKATLVFSNYPHHVDAEDYYDNLVDLANHLNVKVVPAFEHIAPHRGLNISKEKIYSFWDAYVFADLITYPSVIEGFGNQFLEATYFKKPIALFEHDVFKSDIKPEGYFYTCIAEKFKKKSGFYLFDLNEIEEAAESILEIITDSELVKKITEHNFNTAKKYHDLSLLKKYIEENYL